MQEKDFVSYEYKTVTIKTKDQSKAMDMYEAFGWEITAITPTALDGTMLSLKRDRKQKHKQELSRLERQAEDLTATINSLEHSKTLGASIFSIDANSFYTIGRKDAEKDEPYSLGGLGEGEYIYVDGKPVCTGRSDLVKTVNDLLERVIALENT